MSAENNSEIAGNDFQITKFETSNSRISIAKNQTPQNHKVIFVPM